MNESDVAERDDARWRAIERRDPALAGTFVFGVASTGIYCRPGCPARTPKRENVRFFEAPQAAEAARFRACKRCTPDQAFDHAWPPIARALAAIDAAGDEEAPSLAALAAAAGFSRAQFHRSFVRLVGLTPKRYTSLSRTERTHAGRAAFPGLEVRVGAERSSLGVVVAAMTPRGVCAVELADDEEAGIERVRARFPAARLERDGALDAALASCSAQSTAGPRRREFRSTSPARPFSAASGASWRASPAARGPVPRTPSRSPFLVTASCAPTAASVVIAGESSANAASSSANARRASERRWARNTGPHVIKVITSAVRI